MTSVRVCLVSGRCGDLPVIVVGQWTLRNGRSGDISSYTHEVVCVSGQDVWGYGARDVVFEEVAGVEVFEGR